MSLTSYRAAPPRDSMSGVAISGVSACMSLRPEDGHLSTGRMFEDLAATDFPVP